MIQIIDARFTFAIMFDLLQLFVRDACPTARQMRLSLADHKVTNLRRRSLGMSLLNLGRRVGFASC